MSTKGCYKVERSQTSKLIALQRLFYGLVIVFGLVYDRAY